MLLLPSKWTPEKKREYARERYNLLKSRKQKSIETKSERDQKRKDDSSKSQLIINQYQDYWMDNAIENLHELIATIHVTDPKVAISVLENDKLRINIDDTNNFFRYMQRLILSKRDSVLFSESAAKAKSKKNVKLGYVLPQYAKSTNGRNSVKEKIYNEQEIITRLSAGFCPKQGGKICVLCGSGFDKRIDYLKQSVLPSVTKNAALSGTLSKVDYFRDICPTCYMLGALEWIDDRVIYRSQYDGESIVLYPVSTDLKLLSQEKRLGSKCLTPRTLYSNLQAHSSEGKDVRIQGPYSALLLFLENIAESRVRRLGSSLLDQNSEEVFLFGQWMCLRVPSGSIKNVKIDSIELPQRILQIVRQVDDVTRSDATALRIYSDLFASFILESDNQSRSQNLWEDVGELKERLAKFFIKDDFHSFASLFLRRKGVNIYLRYEKWNRLDQLLINWQLNQIGINLEELAKIKQAANLIAELNLGNISVFYDLERARDVNEFTSALQQGSRRLVVRAEDFASGEMQVNPSSLDALLQLVISDFTRWQVIRDTLLIYAAMYYAIKRRGSQRN